MECVACTQCIDACDEIMLRIDKPIGLIRYTSENALDGTPSRILRPRVILYTALFALVSTMFVVMLTTRVANRLRFRVRNQTSAASSFSVEMISPVGSTVQAVGVQPVPLEPGEMKRLEAWIMVPAVSFSGDDEQTATFRLTYGDGSTEEHTFTLLGPTE